MPKPLRIATVYLRDRCELFPARTMATTRWLRMSEGLAARGMQVDMIVNTDEGLIQRGPNLRLVPYSHVRWSDYDIIKTLFHRGFAALAREGGDDHPFIISKLGSVVGSHDGVPGVHFLGQERRSLYDIQARLSERSRYVTILTEPSRELWQSEFGTRNSILLVPTGVNRAVPAPNRDPYKGFSEPIAVYIGNLYTGVQKHINLRWQRRLNSLGRQLTKRRIRLCVLGPGDTEELDPAYVTYLGSVDNEVVWDYHYFAKVGIALAQGEVQHNESSKIYYYLRAGLPVVSEAPIPNNGLIEESGLGLVTPYQDDEQMAECVETAIHRRWPNADAISYMLSKHTWDHRASQYERLFQEERPA
jgi:glycosyltransferase involved in cell wall biosynthesis